MGKNEVPIELYSLVRRDGDKLLGEIYTPNAFGGEGAYLWGVAAPLKNESGRIIGAVECMRNITERKTAEQELERAKAAAEAATHAKSDFLARMSHEIRTPMNAILGMTELIADTQLDYDQTDYVETLHSSSEMLLSIINDILDFSKIEANQIEIEAIPFDLITHVEDICRIMSVKAHEKGLEIAYRVSPQVHPYVIGDPTRLKQILINLLSNAIKFTDHGQVALHIIPSPKSKGQVQISVSDTGIGIPEEKFQTIFDSFSQADTSTTRSYGGTGLGLAISKRLVELMGGRIWLESECGAGTTFNFTVNLTATQHPPRTDKFADIQKDLLGKKILVVDDNDTNRLLLYDYLSRWGAIVSLADNGHTALTAIVNADTNNSPFDIVFLDVLMPEMDGMNLAAIIKQHPLESSPKIIINTSSDAYEDRIKAKELSLDGFLAKPIRRADLVNVLASIHGQMQHITLPRHKTNTSLELGSSKRLLLVEDIAANRKVIIKFLQGTNINVIEAVNGKTAVEAYTQANGDFDIVLMDREMPEMDGLEATTAIRRYENDYNLPHTPIIALTAHAFSQHKIECLEAGCDAFLSKPVSKSKLIQTIETQLLKFSNNAERSHESETGNAAASDAIPKQGGETAPIAVAIDADLEDLMPEFLEELSQEMKNMELALEQNDFADLRRLAHGFKGAAGNYGMQKLQDAYYELEKAATKENEGRCRQMLENAASILSRLEIKYV